MIEVGGWGAPTYLKDLVTPLSYLVHSVSISIIYLCDNLTIFLRNNLEIVLNFHHL